MKTLAITLVILAIYAYIMGNFSPATLIAAASGHNIKKEGSGNAGTTNVLRVVGKKAALITLIIDVTKGFVATRIGFLLTLQVFNFNDNKNVMVLFYAIVASGLCGLGVFLGHVWPIILDFQGGKGVATALGVLLATNWKTALICLGAFLLVVILTRMVSLGSIVAAICFSFLFAVQILITGNLLPGGKDIDWGAYSVSLAGKMLILLPYIIMVVVLIYKHKDNIGRIIKGEENKISFSGKARQTE